MPYLHIRLLGEFQLVYGDQLITSVNTPRLQSLLAYLILHRQAPQLRKHIAFQFWPDSNERQAHTNLRKLLLQLRSALPDADAFLIQQQLTLQWRPDAVCSLDVAELQALLARTQQTNDEQDTHATQTLLTQIAQLYQGELLPSCYDEWILPVRQQLHQDVMQALEQLINLAEHGREYRAGIHYAQRLLGLDPLHEAAYRRLMQLHALNGDRAAALHDYHTCATLLQRELGVEPAEETYSLYLRILNMDEPPLQPPALLAEAPLIGREAEWRTLLTAWRRVERAQAHFVSIAGEAGIGKTRLAEELIAWASAQGTRTARARSYEAEGGLAYAPVTEWLRARPLKSGLKQLDKMWLNELVRLLPELLTEHAGLTLPTPLHEGWQRQHLFEALARAVLAEKGPLLLVIDDLQWCDHETLAWLHFLLRYNLQARLLVIGTWRPEEVAATHPLQVLLRELHSANQLTTIQLSSLTAPATGELAQRIAKTKLDAVEMQQLYQLTEGHPLFVVETVRAGLGRGGEVSPAPPLPASSPSLPSKVHGIIQSRLAQLSPQARELAGLAATVGRRFTFAVLARASQTEEESLVRALDELWQRRIVREQGADAYDFSHDKIREVAYAGLSQVRRRLFHRRVAEALETVYAAKLDEISGQVAAQYEQARILDKAAHYWRRAGERAVAQFAQLEALHTLSRALELLPIDDPRQRYDLLLARVKLYNHQGMRTEGKRDLEGLQTLVSTLDGGTQVAIRRRAEVALCVADFGRGIGDSAMTSAAAQTAVGLAEQCGADDLGAQAYFLWCAADFGRTDSFAQVHPRLEKTLALARIAGLQQMEAEVLSNLALHGLYSGRLVHELEAILQQSLVMYQKLGDSAGEAGVLGMLAYIIYTQREGNYDVGIRYCERALQLAADGWDAERFALGILGFLWLYQGDYGRARPYLERELVITQQAQNWGSEAGALLELGCLYEAQGDYANAQLYLDHALRLYQKNGSQQQYRVKVLGLLALLYHARGENTQASNYGEAAVNFARKLSDPRVGGDAFTRWGRVLVSEGRLAEAADLFRQALADFRQMEQVNHSIMPLAGLAQIALRQGELAQALSWVEPILTHLQTHQLDRTDEELYVYLVSYQVLRATQDARAVDLLQLAFEQLQARAATLENDHRQQMFWSVPAHAEVLAETQQNRTRTLRP